MAIQSFSVGQVLTAAQVNALQANDYNQTVSNKTASYTLVAADKGTRITMSSTSATTITVNTNLFSAGDTLFIQNLNTGVSTITAGTATVTTSASLALAQWEGGILYFTSASAAIFFKSAGAAASSGALTFIASETFSGVSSVSFNNVFTSTYRNYLVLIDWVGTVNNSTKIRLRASGSDNTNSNYCTQRFIATNTSTGAYRVTGTAWEIMDQTPYANGGYMYFFNPQTSNKTAGVFSGYSNGESGVDYMPGSNIFNATTSFDGFTFYPSAGTATGAIRVYGLANS